MADYGVVPVENSTEGAVNVTLDRLVDSDALICGEAYLEIAQHLHPDRQGGGAAIYGMLETLSYLRHLERLGEAQRLEDDRWARATAAAAAQP